MSVNRTLSRLELALTQVGASAAIRIIFDMSTDDELVAAWHRQADQFPDPFTELLIVELQRREIAF